MLVPLSVLISSFGDGGLVVSVALIIVHLLSDQPVGGFLTTGDGIISMEGLGLGLFTSSPFFPVGRQTPTMCFSTSVTVFTIPP